MKALKALGLAAIINSCAIARDPPISYVALPDVNGQQVYVSNYVRNRLAFLYFDMPREIPLCLTGRVLGESIYIEDVELPFYQTSDSVSSRFSTGPCDKRHYIGIVHNHPTSDSCVPSRVDFARYINDEDALVEMVICNIDSERGNLDFLLITKDLMVNDEH